MILEIIFGFYIAEKIITISSYLYNCHREKVEHYTLNTPTTTDEETVKNFDEIDVCITVSSSESGANSSSNNLSKISDITESQKTKELKKFFYKNRSNFI